MILLNALFYAIFIFAIGYYFITNLQWYSYKLSRVLFHHTKTWWHFVYFLLPFSSKSIVYILVAIIGFSFGTLFAVSAPLAVESFGIAHFGAIFGVMFTAYGFVSGLIGPSLSGYILDITGGNFVVVFTYLGIFCLLSSFLILFVRKEVESGFKSY